MVQELQASCGSRERSFGESSASCDGRHLLCSTLARRIRRLSVRFVVSRRVREIASGCAARVRPVRGIGTGVSNARQRCVRAPSSAGPVSRRRGSGWSGTACRRACERSAVTCPLSVIQVSVTDPENGCRSAGAPWSRVSLIQRPVVRATNRRISELRPRALGCGTGNEPDVVADHGAEDDVGAARCARPEVCVYRSADTDDHLGPDLVDGACEELARAGACRGIDERAGLGRAQQQLGHRGMLLELCAVAERRFGDLDVQVVVALDPTPSDVPRSPPASRARGCGCSSSAPQSRQPRVLASCSRLVVGLDAQQVRDVRPERGQVRQRRGPRFESGRRLIADVQGFCTVGEPLGLAFFADRRLKPETGTNPAGLIGGTPARTASRRR
jgi:hypothetical protein